MKFSRIGFGLVAIVAFGFCASVFADSDNDGLYAYNNQKKNQRNLQSLDDGPSGAKPADNVDRSLTSGNDDDDINHYNSLTRLLGVDLGMMIPFGDYQSYFQMAPMIGLHLDWDAIPPFRFILSTQRASASPKDTNSFSGGQLTVNAINLGAAAVFPMKRVTPYVKLEAAFDFNQVNFNDPTGNKSIKNGVDYNLTSMGANVGMGMDVVVGRELSLGIDVTYHYSVPKKLLLQDGSTFDLASPYATVGIRVNF